jgi:glycosyltransferase involved in cell wall biosynthesis
MKILIINYRYFLSGGPEKYMFKVIELLKNQGHEIVPFSIKSNQNRKSNFENYFADPIGGKDQTYFEEYKKDFKTTIQILDRQFYSLSVKKKLVKLIKETKPDVCYLMHHYNKLSPSVIDACKKNKVPIVMRLSDFFLVCPSSHLLRNKMICEECKDKSLFRAVKHKCIKNSYIGSTIKVCAMYFHRLFRFYKKVNYIVAPSNFTLSKINSLIDSKKLINISSFIDLTEEYNSNVGNYILFVGRIEEEKGVMNAIKAVEGTKYKLIIIGKSSTGYDIKVKDYIQEKNITNVEYLGSKYGDELKNYYKGARCVIIPSIWYENIPNVALEAMKYSKPLLVSNVGSLKELVKENYNGYFFEIENISHVKEKISMIFENDQLCKKLGKNAYDFILKEFNSKLHYNKLIKIFNDAISEENKKWKH